MIILAAVDALGSPMQVGGSLTLGAGAITASTFADGALTDRAFAIPPETPGRPATFLGMLRRVWEFVSNKRTRDRTSGNVTLYGADNVTVLEVQVQSTNTVGSDSTDSQSQGA